MCGRFFLRHRPEVYASSLQALMPSGFSLQSAANVSPGREISLVLAAGPKREFKNALWGLPHSASKPSALIFNARAESLSEKPSFAPLLQAGRCLVPASGYFEWEGPKGRKRLHAFGPRLGQFLVFAGLYDRARSRCVIVTTEPNALARAVHGRMPAILGRRAAEAWLSAEPAEALCKLAPCPDEWLETWELPFIPELDDEMLLPPRRR